MKIGFIELGIMGKNLLNAGHPLVVCSRTQSSVDERVAAGATSGPRSLNITSGITTPFEF